MKRYIKTILMSAVCISIICSCSNSKSKTSVVSAPDQTQAQQSDTKAVSSESEISTVIESDKTISDTTQAYTTHAQQQPGDQKSLVKVSPDDTQGVKDAAKELYDAAQTVAERYGTAGASIMATVFKSSDINSDDAEKINFCNMVSNSFKKDGIWAFRLEDFKITSVVYSPAENSGVLVRYPEEYTGDVSDITADNIDSFL